MGQLQNTMYREYPQMVRDVSAAQFAALSTRAPDHPGIAYRVDGLWLFRWVGSAWVVQHDGGAGMTHVKAALLGDSLNTRATLASGTPPANSVSAIAGANWANWEAGAPFVFAQNLAVSGDTTKGVMSRVGSVQRGIQCVMITTGTNDVNSMSSSANQATIDATYASVAGQIAAGLAALAAAGKIIVLTTIPPNGNLSSSSDSRIQLLDRLNAFIAAQAAPGRVFVSDVFAAMWDATQPTLRVAKTNYMNSDGLHPTNLGALYFGEACLTAYTAAYAACTPNIDIYQDFQLVRPLYSEFRMNTGGTTGTKTNGTGNIADGWRSINNAGTSTFTLDVTPYSPGSQFIGPWASRPVSPDAYWQIFDVSAAAASDNPRLRNPASSDINQAGNLQDGCFGGSEFFMEMEVMVTSPVNLQEVSIGIEATMTAGTAPADQPYSGTTYIRYKAGTATDSSSAGKAIDKGYRAVLRTGVLRVPENISTSSVYLTAFGDAIFNGAGSAVVAFGAPRIWHKATGRLN